MIILPSILYALALTFLIAMLLILAFATVEFYKLLTT